MSVQQPVLAADAGIPAQSQADPANVPTQLEAPKAQGEAIRTTKVKLSVPLDGNGDEVRASTALKRQSSTTVHGTRKLLRRDSLERREASLKGKEGSRQRRRWENDRLLNNPHAEPPLPSDWEIRPTYPRRTIPYYLAPLWDAAEFQRAVESKLAASKRRKNNANRRRNRYGTNDNIDQFNAGISPMEEAASNIPKDIRARLKHVRSAKGLLQDLEEDVRQFVHDWNERELRLREDGLGDAPLPKSLSLRFKSEKEIESKSGSSGRHRASTNMSRGEGDEEDEEIVFVGRNGAMHDMPSSPDRKSSSASAAATPSKLDSKSASGHVHGPKSNRIDDEDFDVEKIEHPSSTAFQGSGVLASEKLIFQALESDKGASFARWLVHCVGSYYGLRTWSVTRVVDGQVQREAYVGVDERVRGFMGRRIVASGSSAGGEASTGLRERCVDAETGRMAIELPQPLWGMV